MLTNTSNVGLDEAQLIGSINFTKQNAQFLETSSTPQVFALAELMSRTHFLVDNKPTPIRSAFLFLQTVWVTEAQAKVDADPTVEVTPIFTERDFIFCIVMFGLTVYEKNGVNMFVPESELDPTTYTEVKISDRMEAKALDVYVSDLQKHTKIQMQTIESATNRLLRRWRELDLAMLLGRMVKEGKPIGEVAEHMRLHYQIKQNVFTRIRKLALELGVFKSKQVPRKENRRVTLDDDVAAYVKELSVILANGKKTLTASQTVNQALRDMKALRQPEKKDAK